MLTSKETMRHRVLVSHTHGKYKHASDLLLASVKVGHRKRERLILNVLWTCCSFLHLHISLDSTAATPGASILEEEG